MRKIFCFMLFILAISTLCSCNEANPPTTDSTIEDSTSTTILTDSDEISAEINILPLPQENMRFYFLSGAGGWSTELKLNQNGTFIGEYHDSEMGENGMDYPNGTVYVCSFKGKFEKFEKLNEHSYKMILTEIKTDHAVGEEWIENDIRFVASDAYGLQGVGREATDFILYLPDTPINQVSEEFLSWWPYRYDQETNPRQTLSCYGILNVTTSDGFFTEY